MSCQVALGRLFHCARTHEVLISVCIERETRDKWRGRQMSGGRRRRGTTGPQVPTRPCTLEDVLSSVLWESFCLFILVGMRTHFSLTLTKMVTVSV